MGGSISFVRSTKISFIPFAEDLTSIYTLREIGDTTLFYILARKLFICHQFLNIDNHVPGENMVEQEVNNTVPGAS